MNAKKHFSRAVKRERGKHRDLIQAESLAAVERTVSEIAHDMKTPLMSIGGFANQVLRCLSPDDPKYKKLEIVVKQTARLEGMVRELLDFGRPLELHRSRVDLNELSRDALEQSQPLADQGRVSLRTDLNASKAQLMLDEAKVNQVLLNLISNAIQASQAGGEVCVRTRNDAAAVLLEVSDSGCGIREEDKPKVFRPFFSTKDGGTGLGLAASKKTIESHGGKMDFYPNSPKGTTFTISFGC